MLHFDLYKIFLRLSMDSSNFLLILVFEELLIGLPKILKDYASHLELNKYPPRITVIPMTFHISNSTKILEIFCCLSLVFFRILYIIQNTKNSLSSQKNLFRTLFKPHPTQHDIQFLDEFSPDRPST